MLIEENSQEEINNINNQAEFENNGEKDLNNSSSQSLSLSNISLANINISNMDEEEGEKNKKFGHFILGEKLGQGTFGFVRAATHTLTGEKVAIKILDKEKIIKEKDKIRLKNEIKILKKLRHSNIAQLYGVINTKLSINLVMEYAQGEELLDFINKKQRLKELEACIIFQQMISCLEYLSKNNITHRDLKPENILINQDNLRIKLVDFGLSNIYKNNEMLKSQCGSLCFAAPEMISGKKYNGLSVDIWSSGVTLFSMICGFLPFQEDNNKILYQKIIKGKIQVPYYVSHYARDLLHKILNINPNKRYTIEQIKNHKWFKMIDMNNNMTEGLLLDKYVIPIDENIVDVMVKKYNCNEEDIKINIYKNKHNLITTTYYLLLSRRIKEGKKSICDMTSNDFVLYLKDNNNLLENYNFDLEKVCQERVNKNYINKSIELTERDKKRNMIKSDLIKEEINVKLRKVHKEIDDIKNELTINNNKEEKEIIQPSSNKNKKINIRNLILNEEINSKISVNYNNKIKDNEVSKNEDKKYTNAKNLTNIMNNEISTINTILNSKNYKNENSSENNINSTISYKQNISKKNNVFRITKIGNSSDNKKLSINPGNHNHSIVIIRPKKTKTYKNKKKSDNNIMNELKNNKSIQKTLKTSIIPKTERKSNKSYISGLKDKRAIKIKRCKASSGLIFTNNKKNTKFSTKLFNPNLITNHLYQTNDYNMDYINNTNSNYTMTIYDKNIKNVKSIFPKKNKNLSHFTFGNNTNLTMENNKTDLSKQKQKNKISIIIKSKNKKCLRDIILNKPPNFTTLQTNEGKSNIIKNFETQKKNKEKNILFRNKNDIIPSNSTLIKKKGYNSKKNIFNSCLNLNNNNKVNKNLKIKNIHKSPLINNYKKVFFKNKDSYIPFDLNSIVYMDKNNNIYEYISKILEKENINYIIQKNKLVCWKNNFNFELMISTINKNKKIFKINFINKNGKENIYKDIIINIINQISI